jgi:Animal haem peroxidase
MTLVTAAHGIASASLAKQNSGVLNKQYSKYSYLFPDLAEAECAKLPFGPSESEYFGQLNSLVLRLFEYAEASEKSSAIPAAYTYFGQFINHDMSAAVGINGDNNFTLGGLHKPGAAVITPNPNLVPLVSANRLHTPQEVIRDLVNEHAVPLSLNSLYAGGPIDVPDFYDIAQEKFVVNQTSEDSGMSQEEREKRDNSRKSLKDIPRNKVKNIALIADQRNDENLIISQLHLAFMLFHNKTVDTLKKQTNAKRGLALFAEARALVTKHYHWCIIHDYLERIAPGQLAQYRGRITQPTNVPLEFTTAAFRFGHSQISATYNFNEVFGSAKLSDLFSFSSAKGLTEKNLDQVPDHWIIDWNRFLGEKSQSTASNQIDPIITRQMTDLPDNLPERKDIAHLSAIITRNLLRGYHRFIPSGQALCQKIFKQDAPTFILSADAIVNSFTQDGGVGSDTIDNIKILCTPEQFGSIFCVKPKCQNRAMRSAPRLVPS